MVQFSEKALRDSTQALISALAPGITAGGIAHDALLPITETVTA